MVQSVQAFTGLNGTVAVAPSIAMISLFGCGQVSQQFILRAARVPAFAILPHDPAVTVVHCRALLYEK
jgi:hypothetical protein